MRVGYRRRLRRCHHHIASPAVDFASASGTLRSSERSSAVSTRRLKLSNSGELRSRGRARLMTISSKLRPGRGRITMTRSASTTASSTSWVTSTRVGRVSAHRSSRWSCKSRRSEEHTSELQSRLHLVCRLLLEKKKKRLTDETPKQTTTHVDAQDA